MTAVDVLEHVSLPSTLERLSIGGRFNQAGKTCRTWRSKFNVVVLFDESMHIPGQTCVCMICVYV